MLYQWQVNPTNVQSAKERVLKLKDMYLAEGYNPNTTRFIKSPDSYIKGFIGELEMIEYLERFNYPYEYLANPDSTSKDQGDFIINNLKVDVKTSILKRDSGNISFVSVFKSSVERARNDGTVKLAFMAYNPIAGTITFCGTCKVSDVELIGTYYRKGERVNEYFTAYDDFYQIPVRNLNQHR